VTALELLFCALALVVVGILVFRLHPFFVLVGTALVVTALSPIPPGLPAGATVGSRVAGGFGRAALDVGIPVTMATILGRCLLVSRGAERIVIALESSLGPGRTPLAFTIAGLILGITMLPQAVLSLLLPLAKAAWRTTGRHYLLLVLSIYAGATMTPALVPPAPGPLFVADLLGVDLLLAMRQGLLVGGISALAGLAFARRADRLGPIPLRDTADTAPTSPASALPPLTPSLGVILLPVALIALGAAADRLPTAAADLARLLGDKHVALALGALAAVLLALIRPGGRTAAPAAVREGVVEAGEVVLLIAAGGALGLALEQAGVAGLAAAALPADTRLLIPAAFAITALLRTALGSATVAMVTSAGIVAPLVAGIDLLWHPVYLVLAIGCGSKPGMWMNDSGFWTITRLGGFTEAETLRTASAMITLEGFVGLVATIILATLWPLV
jgi:GntP family gluconate:H+ symporter